MKLPLEGRWLGLVALIAILFAGALVLAVSYVSLPELAPVEKSPSQRIGGIGIASVGGSTSGGSADDSALLDPDPLFLPTEFNASQLRLPAVVRREPGTSLQAASAKFEYAEAGAPIRFPDPVAVPAGPVEALAYDRALNPYEVFGRLKHAYGPVSERVAIVEVVQVTTGRTILSVPLTIASAPSQVLASDWMPLELIAAADATGLIGQPVLSRGSGVEAVDAFFKIYLTRRFHLGERLPPGFYSLRVGP